SLSDIRLENDVAGWLPQDDPQSKILFWYQGLFPSEDRILVSWDDCTLTDPRIRLFVAELEGVRVNGHLEGGSPFIGEVSQPTDLLKKMLSENIPLEVALQRSQGLLTGPGPLRIRYSDAGRLRGDYMKTEILKLANDRFGLNAHEVTWSMPLPSGEGLDIEDEDAWKLKDALTEFLQGQPLYDLQLYWPRMHIDKGRTEEFRAAVAELISPDAAADEKGVVCIEETFFTAGNMAAVSVTLSEQGVADRSASIEAIREAAVTAGVNAESLHLGGRPAATEALHDAVKHAGWNRSFPVWDLMHRSPILLSVLISVVLTYFMLRNLRLTILVQSTSVFCALVAVALVPVTGGSMNMVLVVMPTLLMVLTTSAAIHLSNYWKHSGVNHPVQSVLHAVRIAWLPCALASGTTAIGLASLTVSSLVPVRDFGIYASIGCLISFVGVLYLMPSMMFYWPQVPPNEEQTQSLFWPALGRLIYRYRLVVTSVCLAAAIGCGWGLQWFNTETKVIRYFPDDSRLVQDYNFLEENLSGIVSVDTIVRFDKQAQTSIEFLDRARLVMQIQESLQEHPEVSGTLSLASFLDLTEADESELTAVQRQRARIRRRMIENKVHEKLASDSDDGRSLRNMLAIPTEATDWLEPGDEGLNSADDELWRITCQTSIMSDYDYAQLTRELDATTRKHLATVPSPGTRHIVTGLVPIFLRTQQALLESLIESFGLAFLVIAIVMAVLLRNGISALIAMLPNLLPVVAVFGLLAWNGIRVDIGTMITASVALGIAVDGTLHLITWFCELIEKGHTREEAVAKALYHCGPALWQTSAAIGLGMLSLLPVELLLISRFGWIMASLIGAALIGDVNLLPSLLSGLLGKLLERSVQKRKNSRNPPDQGSGDAAESRGAASHSRKRRDSAGGTTGSSAACVAETMPHWSRIPGLSRRPAIEL
ncbi:MAG: MMPL family transporter, partial [Planctomycetaceae bacterium]|nr:MMPL family transporter [Planctomycetaceae bacterium]